MATKDGLTAVAGDQISQPSQPSARLTFFTKLTDPIPLRIIPNVLDYLRIPAWLALLSLLAACGGNGASKSSDTDGGGNEVPPESKVHFVDNSSLLNTGPLRARGVALVDFDNDGRLDATIANYSGVLMYKGAGDGQFTPFLPGPTGPEGAQAITWADVDGDGLLDLFVTTRRGSDALWMNQGNGQFLDESLERGFGELTYGQGSTFGDLDGDGDLDLYVCQGVGSATLDAIPDRGNGDMGNPNKVYQNDGTGHFTDVTEQWQLAGNPVGESFMAALVDIDDDNDLDVFVVHDHVNDQLFLNPGDGSAFQDVSLEFLPNDNTSIMGIAVADLDGDRLLDLYGTQAGRDIFYAVQEDGTLVNTYPLLLGEGADPTAVLVGWGVSYIDADNDGDLDILSTASFESSALTDRQGFAAGRLVLLRHDKSAVPLRLTDVSDASGDPFLDIMNGWGVAVGDYNHDGAQDALIGIDMGVNPDDIPEGVTLRKEPILLKNDGALETHGWLSLTLEQPGTANPFSVGARVTVEVGHSASTRIVQAGSSYLSQDSYAQHFGLGTQPIADSIRVRWPDGNEQLWIGLTSGEHTLTRNNTNRCCLDATDCRPIPLDECEKRAYERAAPEGACESACIAFEACLQLDSIDASSRQDCINICKTDPPHGTFFDCTNTADCATLPGCLNEGWHGSH